MKADEALLRPDTTVAQRVADEDGALPPLKASVIMLTGLVAPYGFLLGVAAAFAGVLAFIGHPWLALATFSTGAVADWFCQRIYRGWREIAEEADDAALVGRICIVLSLRAGFAMIGPVGAVALGGSTADIAFLGLISCLLLCIATAQSALSARLFRASAWPVLVGVCIALFVALPLPQAAALALGVVLLGAMLSAFGGGGERILGDWSAMREKNNRLIDRLTSEREAAEVAREEARRAGQAKASFLATMSHEIRTPMNGVLGMAQMLRRSVTEPQQRKQVDTLIHSGEFLLSILNDILDISKIDAGKLEIAEHPEDPRRVLESLIGLWAPTAQDKGLTLDLVVDDSVPAALHMDAQRVRQILFNLIGNALKFTQQGGVTVQLRATRAAAGRVELEASVRDTGIGIESEDLANLFERFSQADQSTSRQFGGAGLGLAISRQLCDLMGGRIWAESRPGLGSTFTLTLPLAEAEAIDAPERTEDAPPSPEPTVPGAPRKDRADGALSVLIVDDNPVNLTVLDQILGALGHQVVRASSGRMALAAAAVEPFDLVLLDIQMPGMNGHDTLKALRAAAGPNRKTPVLAVTADVLSHDGEGYAQLGFSGYVSKPIQIGALARALAECGAARSAEAA